MRLFLLGLVVAVLGCGEDRSLPVAPAGKAAGGDLFDLFKSGGSAVVGVDSTAAETPADSTAAAVTDTTETVVAPADTTEQVVSRTPSEARAALDSLGIDYTGAAFRLAALRGRLEVVQLFVQAGLSIGTTDRSGLTVLHWAARNGRLSVVEYLVEGADLFLVWIVTIMPVIDTIKLSKTAR